MFKTPREGFVIVLVIFIWFVLRSLWKHLIKFICFDYVAIWKVQFHFIRFCECDFDFQNSFISLPYHLGSNLISLSFMGIILIFKTLQQVCSSIWRSNLTSLGCVGMILIFKAPWGVCSSIQRFLLIFFGYTIIQLWFWYSNPLMMHFGLYLWNLVNVNLEI
jgi:hypothetical protein